MLGNLMRFLGAVNIDGGDIGLPQTEASSGALQTGLQIVFGVVGAVTLIFIILSALKLTISQGDPQAVAKTRQSIIYAAVGLVIVISAEVIVTFVIGRL